MNCALWVERQWRPERSTAATNYFTGNTPNIPPRGMLVKGAVAVIQASLAGEFVIGRQWSAGKSTNLEVTEADSLIVEAGRVFPCGWPDGTQARAGWSLNGRHGQPHEALHPVVGAEVQYCAVEFGC